MTGGVMVEEEVQYWDLSNDEFNPIEDVDSWGVSVYVSEECSEDLPCYLILSHDEAKDGKLNFKIHGQKKICQEMLNYSAIFHRLRCLALYQMLR